MAKRIRRSAQSLKAVKYKKGENKMSQGFAYDISGKSKRAKDLLSASARKRNQRKANISMAKKLHTLSYMNKTLPYVTGRLHKSASFHASPSGNMGRVSYMVPYANYVWKSNRTGVPKWLIVEYMKNKNRLMKEYANEWI